MSAPNQIRTYRDADRDAVRALYPLGFPEEDLTGLVGELLGHQDVLNLCAVQTGRVVGHAALSLCQVTDNETTVGLLGPLCVLPEVQRMGVGAALIESGALRLAQGGVSAMLVLGDPNYYSNFGFSAPNPIEAPYPLPEAWADAWRIRILTASPPVSGQLQPPRPWMKPELWA